MLVNFCVKGQKVNTFLYLVIFSSKYFRFCRPHKVSRGVHVCAYVFVSFLALSAKMV